jgi:tRNA-Thr(GGU) m(6)t(6)A37 methyltransferase TsaA
MHHVVPVATVVGGRDEWFEDGWGNVTAVLRIADHLPDDVTLGLDGFSHLEVVFLFDRADPGAVTFHARRPRGDARWPEVGLFAARGPMRPNRLGVSRCRLVDVAGRDLHVRGLDALSGSPVLDIKPWIAEFGVTDEFQPQWVSDFMAPYYAPIEGDPVERPPAHD